MSVEAPDRLELARSPLERCVGHADTFVREAWGRRATRYRGADPEGFGDLLGLDDVDRFVTTAALRVPYVRMVRADEAIPERAYTRSGRTGSRNVEGMVDPSRVVQLFDDGATIVLQGLHRWSEPVTRFCRDLELQLGHPCQVNAYVTPPGAKGLAPHADPHDVFVLQAFGSKGWHVGAAPDGGEPIETVLEVGDTLYMPRGTPHHASAQTAISGHLTVGVHVTSWTAVVSEVIDAMGADPALAGDVPAGWVQDPDGFAAELSSRLQLLAVSLRDGVDPLEVADRRRERFLSSRAQLARGALIEREVPLEIDDDTVLRRRVGAVCELGVRDGVLRVLLGDRHLDMPAWVEPAMRRIAEADTIRVGDLAPGLAGASSRLVLARRLIREGLLTARDTR